jgi:hypothetical protein
MLQFAGCFGFLCGGALDKRLYLGAFLFGSYPKIALSLKAKPEIGFGVERL